MNHDIKGIEGLDRALIRYLNLRHLIEEKAEGNVTAFSELVKKPRESVARYGGKQYKPDVRMGDKFAEDIEAAFQLGSGWMDTYHAMPKAVPPELTQLLAGSAGRLKNDALHTKMPGLLPILDWPVAGRIIKGELKDIPEGEDYMLAPVPVRRGFFLPINVADFMPYIMAGMLLQIDMDKRPSAEEAVQRPTFVLVMRPGDHLPTLRLVRAYGDLVLYGPVNEPDHTPFLDPEEWVYGGLIVMRLIP